VRSKRTSNYPTPTLALDGGAAQCLPMSAALCRLCRLARAAAGSAIPRRSTGEMFEPNGLLPAAGEQFLGYPVRGRITNYATGQRR